MIEKALNRDYQMIKQKWLALLVILECMVILYAAIFDPLVISVFDLEVVTENSIVSGLINAVLSIAIFYYCAYKNPGTFLLTLTLIFSPLELLRLFVIYRTMIKFAPEWFIGVFLGTYSILTIWWYILTFKLRLQNQQTQLETVLASPEYLTALSHLQTTTSLEELNSQFHEVTRERSNLFVKNLQKEHELQKKRFSKLIT